MNNKALLHCTGSYIQYPVVDHNGKEYEKDYVRVCVCVYKKQNHLAVHQKKNKHKSTMKNVKWKC